MGLTTMNLLLLAIVAQPGAAPTADAVLQRYADYMKSSPAFTARFHVTCPGNETAQGTMQLVKGKNVRFDAKWGAVDYTMTYRDHVIEEVERDSRVYDRVDRVPRPMPPESRISGAVNYALPTFLMAGDFRSLYGNKDVTYKGSSTVAGKQVDRVEYVLKGQMGTLHVNISVDDKGMPVQVSDYMEAGGGNRPERTFHMDGITKSATIPVSVFTVKIPNGYVPYAFPQESGPLSVGKSFPTAGWTMSGQPLRITVPTLVAFLGAECAASRQSLAALDEVKRGGLNVVLLNESGPAGGRYYRAGGAEALLITGTPTFFLLDAKGKITNLWMGYDPSKRNAFLSEIRAAQKEQ